MPPSANSRRGIGPSACSRTEGKRRGSLFSASSIVPGTVWAWVSMIIRLFPISPLGPGSAARLPIIDLRCERTIGLLDRQQGGRPRAHKTGARHAQRHRADRHIGGQIGDDQDIVLAERVIHALELAADALQHLTHGLLAACGLVLLQALQAL